MPTGAITQYIDVAQIVLYVFWVFFAAIVFYLHRENKREGYPLEREGNSRAVVEGFPPMPRPKTYLLRSGRVVQTPSPERDQREVGAGKVFAAHPGAALMPVGDPLLGGIGPGSYAMRPDTPDLTLTDLPRIVPLSTMTNLTVSLHDRDPRGMPVVGADGVVGGTVRDLWVDRSENLFRYLEVDVPGAPGPVLLPMGFVRVKRRRVQVDSILGAQFASVPRTRDPQTITMLEEERVMAYYGAGTLFATPSRAEPLL